MLKSLLVLIIFFLTVPIKPQIEYTDFNFDWNGWTPVNGSYTNKWELGNSLGYNLTRGVGISNDGGLSNNYTTTEFSIVHLYKDIDFSGAFGNPVLNIRWRCNGEEGFDFLSVHLVPTSVEPVAGVELGIGLLNGKEMSGVEYFRGKTFLLTDDLITEPTMRVVFTWRNNASGGMQPAAAIDNVEITDFNVNYGMWKQHVPRPSGVYYGASAKNSYSLVTIGGLNSINAPQNQVWEYNIPGNRWEQLPNLPASYTHNSAAKFGGYIYSIGGFKDGSTSPTNEVYRLDLSTFMWEQFESLPLSLFYSRALSTRKALYVAGGSDENSNLVNNVYYLPRGGTSWFEATPMPGEGRADGGFVQLNKFMMMYVGGFTNQFDKVQVDSVFIGTINPDDPGDITWKPGPNFPGGNRARIHAFPWGDGKAIVVGGTPGTDFTAMNDVWVFDANTESWSSWQQLVNKPFAVTAYHGTSYNIDDNIWMLVITGGVTAGPAVTNITEVYIDTVPEPLFVELINDIIPSEYYLSQNYPNPFNPVTKINYKIPAGNTPVNVVLKVFDILGNEVAELINEEQPAGEYRVTFNAEGLSSGVYFYRLSAGKFTDTKKFILLK